MGVGLDSRLPECVGDVLQIGIISGDHTTGDKSCRLSGGSKSGDVFPVLQETGYTNVKKSRKVTIVYGINREVS